MLLSMQTDIAHKYFGIEKTVDIFAEVGYDALDFSFFSGEAYEMLSSDGNSEYFERLREYAKGKDLVFNQAHAPFPSSYADTKDTEKRFAEIVRAVKYASILGVKAIVVHPCQQLKYAE